MCLQIIYNMYDEDLALNNLQAIKPNQPTNQPTKSFFLYRLI